MPGTLACTGDTLLSDCDNSGQQPEGKWQCETSLAWLMHLSCTSDQSAGSVEKYVPENAAQLDPNDVKTGSAPDEPVQIPEFTAVDQLGNEVGLEQIKVCWASTVFTIGFIKDQLKNNQYYGNHS